MTLTPEQSRIISNGKALLLRLKAKEIVFPEREYRYVNGAEFQTNIAALSLLDELAGRVGTLEEALEYNRLVNVGYSADEAAAQGAKTDEQ